MKAFCVRTYTERCILKLGTRIIFFALSFRIQKYLIIYFFFNEDGCFEMLVGLRIRLSSRYKYFQIKVNFNYFRYYIKYGSIITFHVPRINFLQRVIYSIVFNGYISYLCNYVYILYEILIFKNKENGRNAVDIKLLELKM